MLHWKIGILRYQIADGWISGKLRGGNEDPVVSILRKIVPDGRSLQYEIIREGLSIVNYHLVIIKKTCTVVVTVQKYEFVISIQICSLIILLHVISTMHFNSPTGGAKIRSLSTLDSREMGVCPEGNSEEEKSGDMRREEKRREEKRREEKRKGDGEIKIAKRRGGEKKWRGQKEKRG